LHKGTVRLLSSAMPVLDYWDVEDILAEQQEVTARASKGIAAGGMLTASSNGAVQKDLKEGAKIQIPYWLAQGFVRRNSMELETPNIYGPTAQEDLSRDPTVCRLSDKSLYYFEVGVRIASLLKDNDLLRRLSDGLLERWREVVNLLGKFGVAKSSVSALNPGASLFQQTFTLLEQEMYFGGREAESHFKQWTERFAVFQMRASHLAEPPSKRQRLT